MEFKEHPDRTAAYLLSAPFIYMMIVPLVILDVFLEVYHRVAFPLYGIKLVDRSRHIKVDRHKLQYLTVSEKVNCAYCGYANGILPYATEIAAQTEQFWCGIMHEKDPQYVKPKHHTDFLPYGDEAAYRNKGVQDSVEKRPA